MAPLMICIALLMSADGKTVTSVAAPNVTWSEKECGGFGREVKHSLDSMSSLSEHPTSWDYRVFFMSPATTKTR